MKEKEKIRQLNNLLRLALENYSRTLNERDHYKNLWEKMMEKLKETFERY